MRAKSFLAIGVLALAALAAAAVLLHRENTKLRAQAATLRYRNAPAARLVEENQRSRELLAQTRSDASSAARWIHDDVEKLRAEIRDLETRANATVARKAAEAAALAANRDPSQALAPLENFQNVGRGSPAAAVQTLVWAVMKAEEPALVSALALAADAREEAEQILAHLPAAARAKYPAAENLAALGVTDEVLRADAVQLVSTTFVDPQHAVVNVRLAGVDGEEKILTELTPDGWRVTVPKKMLLMLKKRMSTSEPAPPPKTNG